MNWAVLSGVFLLATFKFMFSGIPGAVAQIPIWHTYIAMVSGGIFGSTIFFFLTKWVQIFAHNRAVKKREYRLNKGLPIKVKRRFTRTNKFIVRLKRKIGIYGISFFAPLFLSIPIGSIVANKFYGHNRMTYPLIVIGIAGNGLIIVYLSYIFN